MDKRIYEKALKCQKQWNASQKFVHLLLKKPMPVTIEFNNIAYGAEEREILHTFCRKDLKDRKKPLFIYIHGGGWLSGEIDLRDSYVCEFAKLGFFAVSIDYTLSPQAIYPTQIRQCFKAIDFLYENSEKYNIDMDNVLLAGESVGVHYIMHIAGCCKEHSLYDKIGIKFKHKNDFDIKGIISHCGAVNIDRFINTNKPQSKIENMDIMLEGYFGKDLYELKKWLDTEEGRYASPKITPAFPPVFIVWAKRDGYRYDSLDLIEDMKKCNVKYREYIGRGILSNHAYSIMMCFQDSKDCLKETLDFILPYFKKYFIKKKDWLMRE